MRIESESIRPTLLQLSDALCALHADILEMTVQLDMLVSDVQDALILKADTQWEDTYTLCGDARCDGYCRTCQAGEEDYDVDDTEKYCRRRR